MSGQGANCIRYTSGEVHALLAPLLGCQPEDLLGVVVVGVPEPGRLNARPIFADAPRLSNGEPDMACIVATLANAIQLLAVDMVLEDE